MIIKLTQLGRPPLSPLFFNNKRRETWTIVIYYYGVRERVLFSGAIAIFLLANRSKAARTRNATGMSRVWENKCPQLEFRRYLFDDIRTPPTFFLFLPHAPAAKLLTGRVELTKSEGLSFSLAPGVVAVSSQSFFLFYIFVNFWKQPKKVITRRIRVLFILLNRRIGDTYSR